MNRLTKLIDNGLDEIYFEVPSDREGLYNIVDVAELLDDDERDEILFRIAERLKVYEDTGLEPEDILSNIKTLSSELNNAFEKLKEYRRLEEQGLLINLPCKVGDIFYINIQRKTYECKISGFYIIENEIQFMLSFPDKDSVTWFETGETHRQEDLFLTREEAEKALKETEVK